MASKRLDGRIKTLMQHKLVEKSASVHGEGVPALPDHLKRNDDEVARIRELVASGGDHPVIMLNENAYAIDAG